MKKYNTPNKASDIFLTQKREELLSYLEKLNLSGLMVFIENDINSPVMAQIVYPVCKVLNIDLLYVQTRNIKITDDIKDLYYNIIYCADENEKQLLIKDYLDKNYLLISSVNKTQDILTPYQSISFSPLKNTYGNVLFQIFEDDLSQYISTINPSNNTFNPYSYLEYERISSLEIPRINDNYSNEERRVVDFIRQNKKLKKIDN